MNKSELIIELKRLNFPEDSYCIDCNRDESLCLERKGGIWSIYYSERGLRTDEQLYSSESDACIAFLSILKGMLGV